MTRVFRPNPNSLVHQAIAAIGGIKATAEQLGLSQQAVAQWARIDRVPRKELLNLAIAADVPPLELIEYAERSTKPYFFKPSKQKHATLDTLVALYRGDINLEQAYLDTDISPRTLKQTLTLWGDRLPMMRDALLSTEPKAVRAARIGVTVRQLNRLIETYLPKTEKPLHPRILASKEAHKRWDKYRGMVAKAIRGDLSIKEAAAAAALSYRQMIRHTDKYLRGYGFNKIRMLPGSFRHAFAHEVENTSVDIVSPLIDYWFEHKLKQISPKNVENWQKTHYIRCLVGVLNGEIALNEVISMKKSHKNAVIEQFDNHLRMMNTTWASVSTWPVFHQAPLAEILTNVEHGNVR